MAISYPSSLTLHHLICGSIVRIHSPIQCSTSLPIFHQYSDMFYILFYTAYGYLSKYAHYTSVEMSCHAWIETHNCFASLILFQDSNSLCQNIASVFLNRPFGNRKLSQENTNETMAKSKPCVEWRENKLNICGYKIISVSPASLRHHKFLILIMYTFDTIIKDAICETWQ